MTQFTQRLRLYLPDAFARDAKLRADLLQGSRPAVFQTEAKDQDFFLPIGKRGKYFLHVLFEKLPTRLVNGVGLTRANYIVSLANASIPSRERATVLSSIQMLRRLALVILNPFVGWTADYSLRLALFLVGLLPLGTFVLSAKKTVSTVDDA